jgi:hypothetical protein
MPEQVPMVKSAHQNRMGRKPFYRTATATLVLRAVGFPLSAAPLFAQEAFSQFNHSSWRRA